MGQPLSGPVQTVVHLSHHAARGQATGSVSPSYKISSQGQRLRMVPARSSPPATPRSLPRLYCCFLPVLCSEPQIAPRSADRSLDLRNRAPNDHLFCFHTVETAVGRTRPHLPRSSPFHLPFFLTDTIRGPPGPCTTGDAFVCHFSFVQLSFYSKRHRHCNMSAVQGTEMCSV